jgi:hypothetical protein
MGFLVAASTTVPDAEGATYVVISMQPLSDIRSERDSMWRNLLMCVLTVKSSGQPLDEIARHARTIDPARLARYFSSHGRSKCWLDDLAIDIFSVSDLKDRDLVLRVVDEVDDTVLALAYSVPVLIPGQFLGFL